MAEVVNKVSEENIASLVGQIRKTKRLTEEQLSGIVWFIKNRLGGITRLIKEEVEMIHGSERLRANRGDDKFHVLTSLNMNQWLALRLFIIEMISDANKNMGIAGLITEFVDRPVNDDLVFDDEIRHTYPGYEDPE